jgi:arylsulfatase A-like enzyme
LAGAEIPQDVQGKSFLPLLKGKTKGWRTDMYYRYYEYPEPHHVSPHIGIRTNRYKLIRFEAPVPSWELYDLKTDPLEMKNIYPSSEGSTLVNRLKKRLKELALFYGDDTGARLIY